MGPSHVASSLNGSISLGGRMCFVVGDTSDQVAPFSSALAVSRLHFPKKGGKDVDMQ